MEKVSVTYTHCVNCLLLHSVMFSGALSWKCDLDKESATTAAAVVSIDVCFAHTVTGSLWFVFYCRYSWHHAGQISSIYHINKSNNVKVRRQEAKTAAHLLQETDMSWTAWHKKKSAETTRLSTWIKRYEQTEAMGQSMRSPKNRRQLVAKYSLDP